MTHTSVVIRGMWAWGFTMIFVTLKLTDHIDWNWILVLSPAIVRFLFLQSLTILISYRQGKQTVKEPPYRPTGFYV